MTEKEIAPETGRRYLRPTAAGMAALAFIDSGLAPKTENGWSLSEFAVFWEKFTQNIGMSDEELDKVIYEGKTVFEENAQRDAKQSEQAVDKRLRPRMEEPTLKTIFLQGLLSLLIGAGGGTLLLFALKFFLVG